jgi:hypothetical protein
LQNNFAKTKNNRIFAPLLKESNNMIVSWCNGSTAVFGSACLSSNLGETTTKK